MGGCVVCRVFVKAELRVGVQVGGLRGLYLLIVGLYGTYCSLNWV